MNVEQIYTGCLAQGAYYIVSDGEAAIIDPLRESKPYLEKLEKDGAQLKYIFETHIHADFVSGHLDLSKSTGAPIVFGPNANTSYDTITAKDLQEFKIGKLTIKALHTPGHTMESTTYLLLDETGKEYCIFSGDTLFLGDVGRPDLVQKSGTMTQEDLAGILYDSIMTKIMPLPNDILVYPAHGAGSACGKNMMKETVDTLGHQKEMNYALNQPNKEAFVQAVTEGISAPPGYFGANVAMNKHGYTPFETVKQNGLKAMTKEALKSAVEDQNALILDTRSPADFSQGFVPKSINIGLKGDFAPWVGAMIVDVKQPLILVTDPGAEEEAITRLSRVGFDHVLGYLEGGFATWKSSSEEIDKINRISAQQFESEFLETVKTIDVRKEGEYTAEHVSDAYLRPLSDINTWFKEIQNTDEPFYLHCAGGYRSMIAASILQARGIRNFKEVDGGFNAIAKTEIPKTDFMCSSRVITN